MAMCLYSGDCASRLFKAIDRKINDNSHLFKIGSFVAQALKARRPQERVLGTVN
jgi:hypothetical protein